MPLLWILLACTGGTATDTSTPTDTGTYTARPRVPEGLASNVLWLSIDTLRRDALGFYGGGETPLLDSLLSDSLSLADHRTCANWTLPSLLCQLSGQDPLAAGYYPGFTTDSIGKVAPDDLLTLATSFQDAGFLSAWLSTNSLLIEALPDLASEQAYTLRDLNPAEILVHEALDLATSLDASGQRWSLMVHLTDPHTPYFPPPEYTTGLAALDPVSVDLTDPSVLHDLARGTSGLSDEELALVREHLLIRYAGEVRYMDDQLAWLWAELEGSSLLEDALVVLTTDHGEQFWEHGAFSHGRDLYPEELAGIAAFMAPGLTPGVWTETTLSRDVPSTMLHLLGLPPLPELAGAVVGTLPAGQPAHSFFLDEDDLPAHVLQQDGWRIHYAWDGQVALYDAVADPLALSDQAQADPDRLAVMAEALAPFIAQAEAVFPEVARVPLAR